MDFVTLLNQYMDGYAVIIAICMVQLIKYLLPGIAGEGLGSVKWGWARRIMPVLPILIAMIVVIVRECIIYPSGSTRMAWDDGIARGLVSGFAAAYLYRTTKVLVFGG